MSKITRCFLALGIGVMSTAGCGDDVESVGRGGSGDTASEDAFAVCTGD